MNYRLHIVLILVSLFLLNAKAQKTIFYCGYSDKDMGERLCNFTQQSSFSTNAEAEKAVDKILAPLGLPRNFVLVSCPKIENALAITPDDGLRYIVYDNAFISRLNDGGVDWAAMSILAHELGHHLCGHTLRSSQTLEEQRKKELEADEFSGFIMEKLGASLDQAEMAVKQLAGEGDDTYSTHPSKEKRLASIEKGYEKAGGQKKLDYVESEPGSESFYNQGNLKYSNNDFEGAIASYSKAIELNANFAQAYYSRAQVKRQVNDLNGAVADFTLAISHKQDYPEAFNYKGQVEYKMGRYTDALTDLNQAINTLDPPVALAYFYRGMAKKQLNDYQGAYSDLTNALMIDPQADFYMNRGIILMHFKDQNGAITDFSEALNIDPSLRLAYYNRAMAKINLHDYQGAQADLKMWLEYNPEDVEAKLQLGLTYFNLSEYDEAIGLFNEVIASNNNNAKAYYYRGLCHKEKGTPELAIADYNTAMIHGMHTYELFFSKGNLEYELKRYTEAVSDLTQAIGLNPENPNAYILRGLVYQILGEDDNACHDFKKACQIGSERGCMESQGFCN